MTRAEARTKQREIIMELRAEAQARRAKAEAERINRDVIGIQPADDPPPAPPRPAPPR